MFNKGEYVGCLEPAIEDSVNRNLPFHAQLDTHSTNSLTTQRMMAEQVKPDIFHPSHHKLKPNIESRLDALLKEYADEMSIGTTLLTEMMIDTGTSDPIAKKPYLIAMHNYQWVKEEIEKLLTVKVTCSSRSCWSAPIIVV